MDLVRDFHKEMLNLATRIDDAPDCGKATRFWFMLSQYGGIETAKKLINAKNYQTGFTELCEARRSNLTIESFIYHNKKFHSLFSPEELNRIKKRLEKFLK